MSHEASVKSLRIFARHFAITKYQKFVIECESVVKILVQLFQKYQFNRIHGGELELMEHTL